MVTSAVTSVRPRLSLSLAAWAVMLAVSVLPDALLDMFAVASPPWLIWAKLGLLAVAAAGTFAWSALRPLRNFFLILLAILAAELAVTRLGAAALLSRWLGGDTSFAMSMLNTQLQRLGVSLFLICVLLALGFHRTEFFLRRGRLEAPIAPVPWLGFTRPISWLRFGGQWSIYIAIGLLVFLMFFGHPSTDALMRTLPYLPIILILAAMNAFNEEMTYRSTLLAGLESVVGGRQALLVSAMFFGLGHYFGVPFGWVGVGMAAFLGWMLGKAMLETRGFFWAWFIHLVQDVLIFYFMAAGSITAGG
ncbi:MAG: CPBP family intramembrane glutamic endopeptidase [Anaerolineales bacterium]